MDINRNLNKWARFWELKTLTNIDFVILDSPKLPNLVFFLRLITSFFRRPRWQEVGCKEAPGVLSKITFLILKKSKNFQNEFMHEVISTYSLIVKKLIGKNRNAQKSARIYFFKSIFWKIKLYRAPLYLINWQVMGKSPDEQPFLAAYKLRLASANSKTSPFYVSISLSLNT